MTGKFILLAVSISVNCVGRIVLRYWGQGNAVFQDWASKLRVGKNLSFIFVKNAARLFKIVSKRVIRRMKSWPCVIKEYKPKRFIPSCNQTMWFSLRSFDDNCS